MDSGVVGLSVKGMFSRESLTISRNWLVLRGAVSPGSARHQMSKHHNKKTCLIQMKKLFPDVQNSETMMVTVHQALVLCLALCHVLCMCEP